MRAGTLGSVALLAPFFLSGCGHQSSGNGQIGGTLKAEAACEVQGLANPLRQTVIFLDGASLRYAGDGATFRALNPGIIESVVAVADPNAAVQSGAVEPREHVSIYLTPADGGTPRLLFTGCVPALSDADLKKLQAGTSSLSKGLGVYFANGPAETMAKEAKTYAAMLTGAVLDAAKQTEKGDAASGIKGAFAATPFVSAMHASSRLFDPSHGLARLVWIAPAALRALPTFPSSEAARKAGFESARATGLDLGKSELVVANAPSSAGRDFIEAFALGSFARLVSWSTAIPAALPPAPYVVRTFRGSLDYVVETYPAEMRLAYGREGELEDSWLEVRHDRTIATPMSGSAVCDDGGSCHVISDRAGFAQAWAITKGGDAQFDPDLPFAGMRFFDIAVRAGTLTGRIYDPAINQFRGAAQGRRDMTFTMKEVVSK